MDYLRTPDERFASLPDFPFSPNYLSVSEGVRMHYLDEGPRDGQVVLLLHGEPSWSFLYRFMIPPLVAAGYRCLAPDLIGFGRSDKPTDRSVYTFANHLLWLGDFIDAKLPDDSHVFFQDWGGLLGLRLLADRPHTFATATASNTFLPTGHEPSNAAFEQWKAFSQKVPEFPAAGVLQMGTATTLPQEVLDAYDAPFPTEAHKEGARVFPLIVPQSPEDPEAIANQKAWKTLQSFTKPFLTLFASGDPIMRGAEKVFQAKIPGCAGQPHAIIEKAGHFIQEDQGQRLASHLLSWWNTLA